MKLSPSEIHIQQLFQSRYKISLNKIDELNGKKGPTSDFEFVIVGQRVFVCELKDFVDVPLSEEYGFTVVKHSNSLVEAYKKSNATTRISKHIYEAYKQLSKYPEPKIIVFLNFSRFLSIDDLDETFKGYRVMGIENGTTFIDQYAKRASEGKIKEIKKAIDLYIWVDSSSESLAWSEDKMFFRTVTEAGERIGKGFFGMPNTVA